MDIEKRVLDYWTVRAHDFGIVRRNEIRDGVSARWGAELDSLLPGSGLRILDVGTGTGYFAVLLGKRARCHWHRPYSCDDRRGEGACR